MRASKILHRRCVRVQVGDTEEDEVAGAAGAGAHGVGHAMHMDDEHDEHHGLDEASLKEHEEVTKVKVRCTRHQVPGMIFILSALKAFVLL